MKEFVEIEPICPFIGKPCIKDNWQRGQKIMHPCIFWDEYPYNGIDPQEPCKLKRALNKILANEVKQDLSDKPVEVPWNPVKE